MKLKKKINLVIIDEKKIFDKILIYYLWSGEKCKPFRIDNRTETSNKCSGLVFDLGMHAEMGHQMNVIDPGSRKNCYLIFLRPRPLLKI